MSRDWTIADLYFYQAGPLPEDRDPVHSVRIRCPCKEHRSYQAKRKPRGACETCWRFFVGSNPIQSEAP